MLFTPPFARFIGRRALLTRCCREQPAKPRLRDARASARRAVPRQTRCAKVPSQTNLRSRNLHPGCPGLSPVSGSPRAPIHGERLPKPTTRPRVVSPLRVASVVFHPCRPPAAAEDRRPFDARPRRRPGRRAARARGAHLERADVLAHLALRIHLDHELEVPYRRV